MRATPAGAPHDLFVVCNGGGLQASDLPPPPEGVRLQIVNRENQGYNIGAWDAGWRAAPGYDYYLFLQDEVHLRRAGWLAAFLARHEALQAPSLLGESLMWEGLAWDTLAAKTEADHKPSHAGDAWENPIDRHRALFPALGVDEGAEATHLQTLVLFADGGLMAAMDGFPARSAYKEAVTCEIAISRKAAACGAKIAQLDPARRFSAIVHPQWVGVGRIQQLALRRYYRLKAAVKARLLPA